MTAAAPTRDYRLHDRVEPSRRMELRFAPIDALDLVDDPLTRDISAGVIVGATMFVASDEGATLERLRLLPDGTWGEHVNVAIADYVSLPAGATGEMDVEGLATDGNRLWIVGSHSLTRDDPEPDVLGVVEGLDELTNIDRDPNRYFLGYIPFESDDDGGVDLVEQTRRTTGGGVDRARKLPMDDDGGNQLMEIVADDEHFGAFVGVPRKENGFDIEGIAVSGDRVFLGVRGPVINGWAMVLEVRPKPKKKRRLKLRRYGDGRYRKHFVHLAGLGIRDLAFVGEDLFVLAGPTMDLDGPNRLYRWPNALDAEWHSVTARNDVELVATLPTRPGADDAEALAVHDGRLIVMYDAPSSDRMTKDGDGLVIDVFDPVADLGIEPV